MNNFLAQDFGKITPPTTSFSSPNPGTAIGNLIQTIIYILLAGAGIYALINFILAGYAFMSAEGDPKKIEGAWGKIWQTALGLALAAGSFVLAGIFGQLIFNDPLFLLRPRIGTGQ